ncbi:e3 ubiquitin-protein ligase SMURF1 [Caerostris darwini]|uniref:HECT-type E3 ubiquitin transferase n=1 Tax=Caerostris darwini TaxID=1538125 RepID=A0AAV4V0M6_9ARAC|nr:e3 ubiquitin-protein ligase SMURF1 [Caerostris darwini]
MSQLSLDWIISESFDIKAIDPSTIDTSQFDYENLITWIRTLSENSELQNIFSFFDTLSVHFFNERTPDSIQQAYRLKDLALAAQNTMVVHLSGELQALTDHYKKEMNAMSQMLQDLKSRLPPPESVAPINKKTKRTKPLTSSNTKKTKSSNNDMVLSNKFSALDNGTDIDTPATTVNDQANEIEITKAINDMQVDDEFPSLNDSTKINDSKKRAYIPPIVVDKVNDGKKLMGELNALTNEKVTARVVGDKDNNISTIIDTNFSVEHDAFGQILVHELKPNGKEIPVTEENKREYVRLYVNYRFMRGIEQQFLALMKGFNELIPQHLLKGFDEKELELVIGGLGKIDLEDWKINTRLKHCNPDTNIVKWFWKAVDSYSEEQRARLLQFVTGSSRVPLQGFKALQGSTGAAGPRLFTIHLIDANTDNLPKAHTCFNRIDIPPYESYEKLYEKLTQAIEETCGFAVE